MSHKMPQRVFIPKREQSA